MSPNNNLRFLKRKDDRIIIHFDYDCFYASVVEAEDPSLRTQPLAIQQKQIIVTCNYEARRRGLSKLQLITEAKKTCPDVVIVLGEDLTRFRNASKKLYNFLRAYSWNDKVERLGFDEVFMDVTDMIEYNLEFLNRYDLQNCFFQMLRSDPTVGFSFDGSRFSGHVVPADGCTGKLVDIDDLLSLRLMLGSHLAMYLRHRLEELEGYTSTVGISTSKLLSKLIGNVKKPKNQTTLLPPYEANGSSQSTPMEFLDKLDVGLVPWIGFKLAQKIRAFCLQRPAGFDEGLIYGGTKETVTVADVRLNPDLTPQQLTKLLEGPGSPHGIGEKVFRLVNAIDDTEVSQALNVPRQISIEDSYIRLDTMDQALKQLFQLCKKLIERMRLDLMEGGTNGEEARWIGRPATLRLSTRPRPPLNADGTRTRTFKRISRSAPLPNFVFIMDISSEELAKRMVDEALVPLFRKLHPERNGWNLSLVNVAVTDIIEAGTQSKRATGRDISSMFRNQDAVLEDFRIKDETESVNDDEPAERRAEQSFMTKDDEHSISIDKTHTDYTFTQVEQDRTFICTRCNEALPRFAQAAHERYHDSSG